MNTETQQSDRVAQLHEEHMKPSMITGSNGPIDLVEVTDELPVKFYDDVFRGEFVPDADLVFTATGLYAPTRDLAMARLDLEEWENEH